MLLVFFSVTHMPPSLTVGHAIIVPTRSQFPEISKSQRNWPRLGKRTVETSLACTSDYVLESNLERKLVPRLPIISAVPLGLKSPRDLCLGIGEGLVARYERTVVLPLRPSTSKWPSRWPSSPTVAWCCRGSGKLLELLERGGGLD